MDPEAAQHEVEDAERSLAYEYVVILEEIVPAMLHGAKKQEEKAETTKHSSLFLSSAQTMVFDKNHDPFKEMVAEQAVDEGNLKYP